MAKKMHMLVEQKFLEATVEFIDPNTSNPRSILVKFAPCNHPSEVYMKRWQLVDLPKIGDQILVQRDPIKVKGKLESRYYAIKIRRN